MSDAATMRNHGGPRKHDMALRSDTSARQSCQTSMQFCQTSNPAATSTRMLCVDYMIQGVKPACIHHLDEGHCSSCAPVHVRCGDQNFPASKPPTHRSIIDMHVWRVFSCICTIQCGLPRASSMARGTLTYGVGVNLDISAATIA